MQVSNSIDYDRVRASFILRGTTLNSWCRQHSVSRQWAAAVLKGERKGPAAEKLRGRLLEASASHD